MRTIEQAGQFRRDYKREAKGRLRATLEADLRAVIALLLADERLPDRYRDHALSGDWIGCRDCHIKPDLVMIYEKPDAATLRLIRIGSHSELGW